MHLFGPKQLADGIRAVRKGTIQIAEDIPESEYHYRPAPESRSAAETLAHIAPLWNFDRHVHEEAHLDSLEGFDILALIREGEIDEKRPRSKAEIIEMLRTEGDRFARWVEGLPESLLLEQVVMPGGALKSRFELIMGTREHEMQHQAQLTVIERLLGIVPHTTRSLRARAEPAAA